MSPEVQNRGISDLSKRTYVLQNIFLNIRRIQSRGIENKFGVKSRFHICTIHKIVNSSGGQWHSINIVIFHSWILTVTWNVQKEQREARWICLQTPETFSNIEIANSFHVYPLNTWFLTMYQCNYFTHVLHKGKYHLKIQNSMRSPQLKLLSTISCI